MTNNLLVRKIKHTFPDIFPELVQLVSAAENIEAKLSIAPIGVYNAGKSSLLNVLTGNIEQEYFPTRDIPETKEIKTLEYNGALFIDTPGLDVADVDTARAYQGVAKADILLFVHKLSAGTIQAKDFAAMQQIVSQHNKPERTLMVITEGEQAKENQGLIADLTKQFQTLVPNSEPFVVSNTMFIKGSKENKKLLAQASGIPTFMAALNECITQVSETLQQNRQAKMNDLKDSLLEEIQLKKDMLLARIENIDSGNELKAAALMLEVTRMQIDI